MNASQFSEVELQEMWSEQDERIRSRSAYVSHWLTGAKSSASVYFEIDPGKSFGRHRHTAEETILILEGDVEVVIGDEVKALRGPSFAVAPTLVHHDIRCIGSEVARCVGFWSSSAVVSIWDAVLQPRGSRRAGTPIPESI